MTVPVAGYKGAVYFSATVNPPTTQLLKVREVSGFNIERAEIDKTEIGLAAASVGGEDSFLGKYKGTEFTIKCMKQLADAVAVAMQNVVLGGDGQGYMIIRDSTDAASATNGYGFRVLVKKFTYDGINKGDDEAGITFHCKLLGAPVVANGTIPTIPT